MKDWTKRIFGKNDRVKRSPNWNLTIADLMKEMTEGKRKSLGDPELDWAREYEKSWFLKIIDFLRKGIYMSH